MKWLAATVPTCIIDCIYLLKLATDGIDIAPLPISTIDTISGIKEVKWTKIVHFFGKSACLFTYVRELSVVESNLIHWHWRFKIVHKPATSIIRSKWFFLNSRGCPKCCSHLGVAQTSVSEHFSAESAHFKSKNIIQFWHIGSPEKFKLHYVQFFLIMIILRSWSSPRLNLSCIVWKLLMHQS